MSTSEQTSASKREPGFYIVKKKDRYTVAEWNQSTHDDEYSWFQTGSRLEVSDEYWDYIDDNRVVNFVDQQATPTQQLAAVADEMGKLENPQSPFFQYLRFVRDTSIARQPDELAKAQARIRELEEELKQYHDLIDPNMQP